MKNKTRRIAANPRVSRDKSGIRYLDRLIIPLLIVLTFSVFWQVRNHEFIKYLDDGVYLTDNIHAQAGLTREGILWAFTTGHAANWHPLTWLSHMLDCQLYGLNPKGHHLTNVAFHIANTLLLFLVFRRMTGTLWRSAFVAALFALHPLHVESVAWAAERKDVLSTFFWMLTMWAYVRYKEHSTVQRYLWVALALALGLMAKPMLVTLPFVLLLLDYWPLGRFHLGQSAGAIKVKGHKPSTASHGKSLSGLVWEKVPLFVLVAVSSLATLLAQQRAVASLEGLPVHIRFANALVAYVAYIGKTIWPSGLTVFYPHPLNTLPMWKVAGACLLVAGVSCLVLRRARRQPYLAVGWLWYLGTLVPVIGVVQVGAQSMADRYMYVPLIGLAIMISWGIPDLVARWRFQRIALPVLAATLVAAVMIVTWWQVSYWHDSVLLFQRALDVTDNNYVAHSSLGSGLAERGRITEAIDHLSQAIRIKPSYAQGHYSLGFALAGQGRNAEAIAHLSEALRIRPHYAEAHNNLGVLLAGQGKSAEAIAHVSKALRLKPDYPDAHNNLGGLLAGEGKSTEAIAHFSEALRLKPGYVEARTNLQRALDARQPGSLPQKP